MLNQIIDYASTHGLMTVFVCEWIGAIMIFGVMVPWGNRGRSYKDG